MPARLQRRRTRGWRAPAGARYVGRGTRWGNPWIIQYDREHHEYVVHHEAEDRIAGSFRDHEGARWCATAMYRTHLAEHPELTAAAREELRGRDLLCWCGEPEPGQPDHCHAAVLLEISNPTTERTPA